MIWDLPNLADHRTPNWSTSATVSILQAGTGTGSMVDAIYPGIQSFCINRLLACREHVYQKHVEVYQLSRHTVKEIHTRYLKPPGIGWSGQSKLLLIDEFAFQNSHRYATVIVDAVLKQVLWVGRGRSRDRFAHSSILCETGVLPLKR